MMGVDCDRGRTNSRIGGLTRRKTSGEKESVIIISAMKVQNFIVICKNIYDKAVFIIFFAQGYFFIHIHGFLFHGNIIKK